MTRKESEEEKRLFLGLWEPISAKISLWQIRNAQQFVGQQLSWLDLIRKKYQTATPKKADQRSVS